MSTPFQPGTKKHYPIVKQKFIKLTYLCFNHVLKIRYCFRGKNQFMVSDEQPIPSFRMNFPYVLIVILSNLTIPETNAFGQIEKVP
jgi:hypothetical protein